MDEAVRFIRENRLGMKYLISEVSRKEVSIQLKGTEKIIFVKVPILSILAAWYKWQILDKFIQEAFDFLNDNERDFILSGLSFQEWNEIYGENGELK
jgi:hypothetical protein